MIHEEQQHFIEEHELELFTLFLGGRGLELQRDPGARPGLLLIALDGPGAEGAGGKVLGGYRCLYVGREDVLEMSGDGNWTPDLQERLHTLLAESGDKTYPVFFATKPPACCTLSTDSPNLRALLAARERPN